MTDTEQFTNLDDYLQHYISMGFKLVKDDESDKSRTLTLRSYVMGEYSEAIITQRGSEINVRKTVDGKVVS